MSGWTIDAAASLIASLVGGFAVAGAIAAVRAILRRPH